AAAVGAAVAVGLNLLGVLFGAHDQAIPSVRAVSAVSSASTPGAGAFVLVGVSARCFAAARDVYAPARRRRTASTTACTAARTATTGSAAGCTSRAPPPPTTVVTAISGPA